MSVTITSGAMTERELTSDAGDLALAEAVAQGGDRAFTILVSRFTQPLFAFLYRMLSSREDAEDLTQEVFYEVHKRRSGLRPDRDPKPYLFTIARRKAITKLRWRGVRRILKPLSGVEEETLPDSSPDPRQQTNASQNETIVNRALSGLKPDKRAAVILRYFEGMAYREIAQIMDKPEGSVKSLVYRGLEDLRGRLAHFEIDELLECHHEST